LGPIGSERAVEPLLARLEDEDASVRRAAAEALGPIGSERAVEPLLARLEDEYASVRRAAASALGRIGSERAVEPLLACLEDEAGDVRRAAASALGRIGSEQAISPLLACLEDRRADRRIEALSALSQGIDELDKKLLLWEQSWRFNLYLDPRKPIKLTFAQRAARRLNLTIEEAQARYQTLAKKFNLVLEWKNDN
jgi:HEAT repeat protein